MWLLRGGVVMLWIRFDRERGIFVGCIEIARQHFPAGVRQLAVVPVPWVRYPKMAPRSVVSLSALQ